MRKDTGENPAHSKGWQKYSCGGRDDGGMGACAVWKRDVNRLETP